MTREGARGGARESALARLAALLVRRPGRALGAIALLTVLAAVFGTSVIGLMTGDVGDPDAESQRALDRLTAASGQSATPDDLVLLVDLPARWPAPAARRTVDGLAERLGEVRGVARVVAPTPGQGSGTPLVARDGRAALVTAGLDADADQEAVAGTVEDRLGGDRVLVGGEAAISKDIDDRIARDLSRAETLAFPVLLLLAVWIFRGVVAALVPLAVGGVAILLSLGAMRLVATQVTLSQYVLNLAIGMGLGLAIDYCLFLVSRYREEVQVDGYGAAAVRRTVASAGRAVLFSAATVVLALATLTLFPQEFLYSMGIGGMLVAGLAALVAVTLVPAVLVLLGPRIDALALPAWRRAREQESSDAASGRWYVLATWVMRHAAVVLPVGLLVALVLAAPALRTTFGDVDQTALPVSAEPRVVSDRVAAEFPGGGTTEVVLAVSAPRSASGTVGSLADRAADAASATLAAPASYVGKGTWLVRLSVPGSPFADRATGAVDSVRAVPAPVPFLVGGQAASFDDLRSSIGERLPWALLVVAVAVLLVMLLLTSSLVLAVKTLVLNALNVTMTFGVLVWVFQMGHLEGLLGFTSTGRIDLTQPVLVAVIAFGLSTDYGVFLFDRILEAHRRGADDVEAVAFGVGRSGRIISSAALLLCVAIGAFSTSSILFIKQLGVGAAVAVFLDATLVRAVLVPSAMRLMGRANWWSPAPIRRLLVAGAGRRRWRLVVPLAVALLVVVVLARFAGEEPREAARAVPATPTAEPTAPTSAGSTGGPAERAASGRSAVPRRLRMPDGSTLPVRPVGLDDDGVPESPGTAGTAGWWRGSARVGDPFGSMVLAGHVDCATQDPGPFYAWMGPRAGSRITVSGSAVSVSYTVAYVRYVDAGDLASLDDVLSPRGAGRLTLVTCAGAYDADAGGYQDLAVTTARRADG